MPPPAATTKSAKSTQETSIVGKLLALLLVGPPDLRHLLLELLLKEELPLQFGHVVHLGGGRASASHANANASVSPTAATVGHSGSVHHALHHGGLAELSPRLVLDGQSLGRLPRGPGLAGHRTPPLGGTVDALEQVEVDPLRAR